MKNMKRQTKSGSSEVSQPIMKQKKNNPKLEDRIVSALSKNLTNECMHRLKATEICKTQGIGK